MAVAVSLFLIGSSPAEADGYLFTGTVVLVPATNPDPNKPSDSYYYTQIGSLDDQTDWVDEDTQYYPAAGIYAPAAPSSGDDIGIYGYASTQFPPDLSGYIPQNSYLGYTNDGFDVSGSGTFQTMTVVGPGDLNLGTVTITGNTALGNQGGYATSISAVGGIPSYDLMGDVTNYSPAAQYISGSLTTPTLELSIGTTLEPGNGTTNVGPDPVADAGSMTIDSATITTQVTQIYGFGGADNFYAPVSATYGYVVDPIELDDSTLTATTELDLIGSDPANGPLVTGATEIDASNSTITGGAIVIATGNGNPNNQYSLTISPGYGSGLAGASAEIDLDGSKLIATDVGDDPPSLVVGDTGDGTLDADDGSTIESMQTVVGNSAFSTGTVTLDDSTWTNESYLTIGNYGDALVTVTDGANLETDDVLYVGLNSDSTGELDISDGGTVEASTTGIDGVNSVVVGTDTDSTGVISIDGSDSGLDSTGDMQIGYDGDGTVTVTDGGLLEVDGDLLRVGHDDGGTGLLEITGSGSKLDAPDTSLYVGYGGMGTVKVFDGATLTVQNTSIGSEDTGDGEMDVDGSDTMATLGEVTVGDAGQGLLTVTGGATANTNDISIGAQADSLGGVLVDGDGSTLTADGDLTIGDLGDGSMQVSDNAKVTADSFIVSEGGDSTGMLTIESGGNMTASDDSTIGDEEDSDGTVTVDGTSSVLKVNGDLKIGGGGTGELDISDNGSVTVQGATVGDEDGSQGTVDISGSGSILHSTGDFTIGNSGQAEVTVSDGGTLRVDGDLSIGKEEGSNGSLTIDGDGSTLTYSGGDVSVGSSGTGEMTVQNGAFVDLSGTAVNVGDGEDDGSPGEGTLTITGSGSTLNTGDLGIASKGTGSLVVEDGGTLSSGDGTVGDEEDSEGDATVTGAGSSWTATGLTVGGKGMGTLDVEDGGNVTVNASSLTIGDEKGGVGTFTLDGEDSSLTFKGEMDIGEDGTGTFALQDGASFTAHAINIGDKDGTGTLNVDGDGTFLEILTDFNVGEGGSGSLNVTDNAGLKSDVDATIADKGGSDGTATVASAATWNVAGNLTVGGQSIGELDIKTEGSVAAHEMTIGDSSDADGTVKVTGTGSAASTTLTYDDTLAVGNNGAGHLDVTDGGSVAPTGKGTGPDAGQVVVGAESTGNGEVTVDGSASHFEADSMQIGVGGTGSFTTTNGATVHVLSTVQIGGNGSLTVAPSNEVPGGAVTIGSTDLLAINGEVLVNSGGTLEGSPGVEATVTGNVVNNGGTIAAGDPAILHIVGDFTQTVGTLTLDVAGTGVGQYDQIDATGKVNITGGTIDLVFIDGYVPQQGDDFNFILAGGTIAASNFTFTFEGIGPGFNAGATVDSKTGKLLVSALNTATASPEPSTWALMLGSLVLLFFRLRVAPRFIPPD